MTERERRTNLERMAAVILAVIIMAAAPAMRVRAADENAASGSAAAAQVQAATAAETATAADAARNNADAKEQAAEQAAAAAEATRQAAEEQAAAQAAADRESSILNGISDYDRQLLGALIYYEAGGEPYQGKVAVGSVVINRMLSTRFPDDMSGVIYQSGQFVPARYCAGLVQRGGVPAECQQAADEAITGAKPVGDSVNFMRKEIHSGIIICCHAFFGHI